MFIHKSLKIQRSGNNRTRNNRRKQEQASTGSLYESRPVSKTDA
jgi:hypothetical protein